jgi:hypothetical protein
MTMMTIILMTKMMTHFSYFHVPYSAPPLTGGNQGRFHFVVVIGCHTMEWFPSNEHRLVIHIALIGT